MSGWTDFLLLPKSNLIKFPFKILNYSSKRLVSEYWSLQCTVNKFCCCRINLIPQLWCEAYMCVMSHLAWADQPNLAVAHLVCWAATRWWKLSSSRLRQSGPFTVDGGNSFWLLYLPIQLAGQSKAQISKLKLVCWGISSLIIFKSAPQAPAT